jgi:SAM-dependent methyltransferase
MTEPAIDEGLEAIRAAVHRQLGVDRIQPVELDVSTLPRFSPDLHDELSPERRRELLARAEELEPWLQGPFPLGGDLVVGGAWRNDLRWDWIGDAVGDLSGRRVLDVGSNAGYDPFMFHLRGAARVLAVEPYDFIQQARFLESIYGTGVDFQQIGWQELDPERHGRFDFVHCHGVLYHEPNPLALLQRLRTMIDDGGQLLFGSIMLAGAEFSEYARFVPDSYLGDETWWWVPGRLAMRWMLETVGFVDVQDLGMRPGIEGEFPVGTGYFRAVPGQRLPHFEEAARGAGSAP